MRILVINWQDIKHPMGGGAEVHLHEVFERIARRGHEVTLYCCSFPGAPAYEELNGIRIIREGSRPLFNYHVPLKYFSTFRHQRFDLIVDDMNKIPFYTPLFVKEPLLGITHHLFGKSIFLEASYPAASYVYWAERWALPMYKKLRFIVGSPSTYKEMLQQGFAEERTHLIPYGVAHESFRQTGILKSSTPLVGMVGRLKRYKSVDHLLEAFAIVLLHLPEANLLIVGDGDDKPRLTAMAHSLGIDAHVTFAGFVSEAVKVAHLNRMHIAVNTSAKEGWGLTVIEANACGIPTVSSNVQGLRDAVVDGETGLLYEYGNREQLAEKILLLLRDDHLREQLSQKALEWSARFDWNSAADCTLDVMERVIAEHRSAS
ncbi:MAG: glycosyltransferase family 4 protein [Ignavibacteriales bacterium]|nr:glycosyltransferase family 4 protein [Ignavibacteriales bacterium]